MKVEISQKWRKTKDVSVGNKSLLNELKIYYIS